MIYSIVFYNTGRNRDRTLKITTENFHITFSNSDFSVNICSISSKSLENLLYYVLVGTLSQMFYLGPDYLFMLCRNFINYFFTIIYILCHNKCY